MLRPGGDIYKNNRNQKIYKACYNACISLFNAKPIYIDENKKKMTAKFTDEKFGGLHEGIEVFREFLVEGKANIFGAIVLADCSDESDQIIKFYVNFYKLKNRYKAEMFHIVKFYTGEESEKIVHGKNLEAISNFETTLNSKAPAGENTSEILFSLNKKKMVFISGSVLIIACGAFFFREQIKFEKSFSYEDFFITSGVSFLLKSLD